MARSGDGLALRGRTWYLDIRVNGRRYAMRLGKDISRSVARELASVKRAAILKNDAGIGKKKQDVNFKEARQKFEAWMAAEKRPSTVKGYQECLLRLSSVFESKRLSEITPWILEKYRKDRTDAGAPIRANRELATLKNLFNKAVAWKLYEGDNPVCAVTFRKEPRTRLRVLEVEEEARLLAVSPEPLRSMITIAINTGLRRSELLTLRWADVDLRRGLLTVAAAYAKTGRTRTVPLNSIARQVFKQLRDVTAPDSLVFPGRQGRERQAIQTPFDNACDRAGLIGVTMHTLRHTFASRLVLAGVDLRTVQEVGGWQTISMVERYSHLNPAHKAQAVEKLVTFHNGIHNSENDTVRGIL